MQVALNALLLLVVNVPFAMWLRRVYISLSLRRRWSRARWQSAVSAALRATCMNVILATRLGIDGAVLADPGRFCRETVGFGVVVASNAIAWSTYALLLVIDGHGVLIHAQPERAAWGTDGGDGGRTTRGGGASSSSSCDAATAPHGSATEDVATAKGAAHAADGDGSATDGHSGGAAAKAACPIDEPLASGESGVFARQPWLRHWKKVLFLWLPLACAPLSRSVVCRCTSAGVHIAAPECSLCLCLTSRVTPAPLFAGCQELPVLRYTSSSIILDKGTGCTRARRYERLQKCAPISTTSGVSQRPRAHNTQACRLGGKLGCRATRTLSSHRHAVVGARSEGDGWEQRLNL